VNNVGRNHGPPGQRSGTAARSARVSRRRAQAARAELDAGGLSHQERRRLRSITRVWDEAARRRRLERRHTVIVVVGAVAAMAVVGASFGLVPAIAAAAGQGTTGTFVVGHLSCSGRYGCTWVGTFQARNGAEIPDVAYEGRLPAGAGQGERIPARHPGGSDQVFALHGSHTWVMDLLLVIGVGVAVAAALWISPLGTRGRAPRS
jgi:hypothetical protein